MKAVAAKKWLFGIGAALSVAVPLMPAAVAHADTYPYFKEYGADVSAGGWFNDSSGCPGSNYQTASIGSPYSGGIVTYANNQTSGSNTVPVGGSSSQYAVFATGNVDGASGTPYSGFYSDGAVGGSKVSQLTFANVINGTSSVWGGAFDGGTPRGDQCITDYYDAVSPKATQTYQTVSPTGSLTNVPTGIYSINASGSTYTLPGGTISPGQNITLVVTGNVLVTQPITYDTSAAIPKFALVVHGNIYVAPNVTDLDGWYIAQPNPTSAATISNTGIIWTCSDGSNPTIIDYTTILGCTSQLTINGALTAKRVEFTRIGGNVLTANTGEDSSPGAASNAAEVINYTPYMVLGGGFFNQSSSSTKIESLISLPPVF